MGAAVSDMLKKNSMLTKLDLSWNNLSKTHALQIGQMLALNKTLVALNLAHNCFGTVFADFELLDT